MKKSKNYTIEQRQKYHEKRVKSPTATVNQKAYSWHWLDGFTDEHAENNIKATKNELQQRKLWISKQENETNAIIANVKSQKELNKIVFGGYINGATAKLGKKQ